MTAGESDQDRPSAGSAGEEDKEGEEDGKDPIPPPVDMNPLDPNLMPRPLLCSTADSTSAFSVVGETHTTDTRTGLPTVGESVASQEVHEGEKVDQSSPVVPSESSVVSSQSVAPTSSGSLCDDASQLEAAVTGSDATQLDLMASSLSSIHELLGMPEPDMSSAVSSSQGGGDVELLLSRIASGTPEQPAAEPVGGHTLEETLVSDGCPTTTQEEAEEVPAITEDETARRTVGEDQEVSPDTQAEGSHLDRWLGGEPAASSSSVDSSSLSNLTPPDLDLDSAEPPRFFTSQQVEREKESAVAGMQEVACSTAEGTASPDAQVQTDVSEPLPPLPQQAKEPTTSGTAHPMSQPVDASHSPTVAHPSKVLPVMKGVKLEVVVKRREEEGPVGSREEEPGGMKEEEGLRESSEQEGSSASLLEDTNTEQAKEEETPHDDSYREQLVTSHEQEGVMMWTQHTTDVSVMCCLAHVLWGGVHLWPTSFLLLGEGGHFPDLLHVGPPATAAHGTEATDSSSARGAAGSQRDPTGPHPVPSLGSPTAATPADGQPHQTAAYPPHHPVSVWGSPTPTFCVAWPSHSCVSLSLPLSHLPSLPTVTPSTSPPHCHTCHHSPPSPSTSLPTVTPFTSLPTVTPAITPH